MLHRVVLPQLGQTMEEGTIEKWHKQEGDAVKKGELLFELTTDKATLEVNAFADGLVRKLLVPEGATVPVNSVVALIGDESDELPDDLDALVAAAAAPKKKAPAAAQAGARGGAQGAPVPTGAAQAVAVQAAPVVALQVAPSGKPFSSPRARKMAEEKRIALGALAGSGPDGRIVERDILDHLDALEKISYTPAALVAACEEDVSLLDVAAAAGRKRVRVEDVRRAVESGAARPARAAAGRSVELSPMRRTIAQRMSTSKQTVPHFYIMSEIEMAGAREFVADYSARVGAKVTVTALLIKAVGRALKAHPRVNAYFAGDRVVLNSRCNVGVAVGVEDGLFVPVIRDADRKDLAEIAAELKTLAGLAREGKLLPEQYEGGSITLSNLGMFGVDAFLPIINPPESCIMGVGTIREKVVARNGGMVVAPVMNVSISADHRAIDGVAAAEFMRTVTELLEAPGELG